MTTVHPREFSTRARGGIRVGALEQAAGEGWSPHPTRRAGRAGKQSVAIANVHHRNGFDVTKGGYEFKVALMAIAAGLLLGGPGRVSIHQMIDRALARRPMAMVAHPTSPSTCQIASDPAPLCSANRLYFHPPRSHRRPPWRSVLPQLRRRDWLREPPLGGRRGRLGEVGVPPRPMLRRPASTATRC